MHKSEIILDCNYDGLNPVSFGFENCAPRHSYGPALRTHYLLHFVVKGKGIFEREGKVHNLSAGDIFIIPPFVTTYYKADEKEPWEYIWIGFNTKMDLPELSDKHILHLPEAFSVFEQMRLCADLEGGKSAYLSGCIWTLLSIILEKGRDKADYIDKALSFIHVQYSSKITVSELARQLSLDRCYFSTLFKKRVGVSPADYLRSYRLSKAAELMRVYGEKPSCAANSVGYDDLAHFSKDFKKKYGKSPRQYVNVV